MKTPKSMDINYPKILFPKSYEKSMYDEMIENGEICLTEKVCEEDSSVPPISESVVYIY